MTYPTDERVEALARFLSEQPDGMEHRYCTDDGLSVPANTPEWTLRADFARAALRAAGPALDREQVEREVLERLVADAENRSQDAAKERRHTEAEMWKGRADWLMAQVEEG